MATIITNGEPNRVKCDRCGLVQTAKPWDHETAMIPTGWSYAYVKEGSRRALRIMLCDLCTPRKS